jgi:hypothetical protein
MSLRDRILTPAGARAVTAPSAILLAGAAASAVILGGLPLVVAPVAAAGAWAARVAFGLPKGPKPDLIDPFAVGEPWRTLVREAVEARTRFERAVRGTAPGPLQDRLKEVGARIGEGVQQAWAVARRGDQLVDALRQLDVRQAQQELTQVQGELRTAPRPDLEATARALQSQVDSYNRLYQVTRDTEDRLRRIDAELDEAVARAIELSIRAGDVSELVPLGSDVDAIVSELESLRQGLDETGRAGTTATS